jgi:hypothetical protein
MLPENQRNKAPDRPYTQTIPKSQQNSGVDLDEACGELGQAEAGLGLDKAIRQADGKQR